MKDTFIDRQKEKIDLSSVQVFTPRWVAEEMLDIIRADFQSKDVVFFEPTCGRGDIVIPILDRLSKYHGADYAIENVFGIDIDPLMIEQCRGRVHVWCINNGVKLKNWKNIDFNFRVQDFFLLNGVQIK
jgi:hypothetical protein